MEEARQLGINGTPSFIVNGTLYRGGLSLEDFAAIVDHKLTLAKTPSPQD
jgi:protein-disulfide isomerase